MMRCGLLLLGLPWFSASGLSPRPDFFEKADGLFVNYTKSDPPFGWVGGPSGVDIQVGLNLRKVLSVNMLEGKIELSAWFRMKWLDPRLSFNGTKMFGSMWSNYSRIPVTVDRIWTPDIYLKDVTTDWDRAWTVDTFVALMDRQTELKEGYNVFWSRPGILESKCQMHLQDFPFDTQTCHLPFESWIHHSGFLRVIRMESGWKQTDRVKQENMASDWQYISLEVANNTNQYNAEAGTWSTLTFVLKVSRNPHYYMMHGILPLMLLVSLAMNSAWFGAAEGQAGSGERIGFSLTLLLTIFAALLFTSERPKTDVVMWMDSFQTWSITLSTIPIFQTAIVFLLQRNRVAILLILRRLVRAWSEDEERPSLSNLVWTPHSDYKGKTTDALDLIQLFDLVFRFVFPPIVLSTIISLANEIPGFWDYIEKGNVMWAVIVFSWVTAIIAGIVSLASTLIVIRRIIVKQAKQRVSWSSQPEEVQSEHQNNQAEERLSTLSSEEGVATRKTYKNQEKEVESEESGERMTTV